MLSGKNQAGVQPYAYGSLLQSSTYGSAVPNIYGCTLSPLLAIWAANLRPGGSSKKFKQLKKGGPTYVENITLLSGHNPGMGILQIWNNSSKIPLAFTTETFTGPGPWTISDPHFYAVVGVSVASIYSATFDDYGGSPASVSGTFQIPLWNEIMNGPDPVHSSAARNYPFCYRWEPNYGATVYADAVDAFADAAVTIYYAQLTAATSFQTPLVRTNLHFENVLGDGNEYTGNFLNTSTPLSTQQIKYPQFFGCGAALMDLGTGGVIPSLQCETQGKWGLYSSGDADFADMIEDIFKSGVAQSAIGAVSGIAGTTPLEHGLSAYSFPGCVQMKSNTAAASASNGPIAYNMNVAEGNFLVVIGITNGSGGGALSIADSATNSWTAVFPGTPKTQVWHTKANASGPVTVTITGQGNSWGTTLLEVAGVDTFDGAAIGVGGTATAGTSNVQNFPGYLLSIALYPGATPSQPTVPQWTLLTPTNYYGYAPTNGYTVQERIVTVPGSYGFSVSTVSLGSQCLLAFKCVNPPTYADPVGDFLDRSSLDLVRLQDRANGLWGSLSMASQQAASDYLKTLYDSADAASVFLGFRLYSMPLSEVSKAGNGVIYYAPTAGGPIINLSTENGDFIASRGKPPIRLKTAARVNQDNVLQMQCLNRTSDYNPSVVAQPDQGSIATYGVRKADPIQNYAVQDVAIARQLLGIQVRKLQYGGDSYQFTLPAKWCLLGPYGAGAGGSGVAALTPVQAAALPARAPGVNVAWATANAAGGSGGFSRTNPFGFAASFGRVSSLTTTGVSLSLLNGWPFPPNSVNAVWGDFTVRALPAGATITGIYPVAVSTTTGGGDQTISWTTLSSSGNFGPVGGVAVGPNLLGSALADIVLGAFAQNTLENYLPNIGLALAVGFVALAVYYTLPGAASGPVPSFAFSADGTDIYDAVLTITDPLADINQIPVRITSITENPDQTLDCEAEPFIYGMYDPSRLPADNPAPFSPKTGNDPGSVNTPIIFEAVPRLAGLPTQPELWCVLSSNNPNYGGCVPFISTNGGSSYDPVGDPIAGSAVTGVSTGDWPAHADPDTTNNLTLDLTESNGSLASYSASQRDAFQFPCYIAGGGSYSIPYEIFTYNAATLTGTNLYTVNATGGGNEIRRGVFAAPSPAIGVDHPTASRFAFLNPGGQGMIAIPIDPAWIGTTIYLKFCAFNSFGGAAQSLTSATAYPYTITGAPGAIGPSTGILVGGV